MDDRNINVHAGDASQVAVSSTVTELAANSGNGDFKSSASAVGLRGLSRSVDTPYIFSNIPSVSRNISESKFCLHCGKLFTPRRKSISRKNTNTYCSKRCAAHAPRPGGNFHTPESTRAERIRANGLINSRIRHGRIIRPKRCDRCGKPGRLDSHHPDYAQPDLVAFLCRSCHMLAHNRGEIEAEVAELARHARPSSLSIPPSTPASKARQA
jgi:hypothetical protein